jgi:hypothetical protein
MHCRYHPGKSTAASLDHLAAAAADALFEAKELVRRATSVQTMTAALRLATSASRDRF